MNTKTAGLLLLALLAAPAATAHTLSLTLPAGHAIDEWHGPTGTQVTTATHFGHVVVSFTGPEGLVVVQTRGQDNTTAVHSLDMPAEAPTAADEIAGLQANVTRLEGSVADLQIVVANLTQALAGSRAEIASLGIKVQQAATAGEAAKRAAEDVPRYNMTKLQDGVDQASAQADKARGVGLIAALAAMLACILAGASLFIAIRKPSSRFEDDGGPLAPPERPPSTMQPPTVPRPTPQAADVITPDAPRIPTEQEIEAWLSKQLQSNPTLAASLTQSHATTTA